MESKCIARLNVNSQYILGSIVSIRLLSSKAETIKENIDVFAILFRILTGAAITKMKGVSASNCTQVCKVETCQPPLVCAARAVRRPISSHCYPCDAIGAGARTLHAFQSLYKLPSENCVRLSTNIILAELYLVSELKFLTTGQGRKCVSLSRNRGEIILNSGTSFHAGD